MLLTPTLIMSPDDTALILKIITHMVFGNTVNLITPIRHDWDTGKLIQV